ncbi:curli production assembly/transport protein CsgE [Pseudoalteromonas sp. APAL1]|jgi:curli production assembly/transport component CsgE|uniref:CsgE family curli-type amyloid fiber assembly protein n=1 Tax=Pseudoalteromonas TaxID=53246 RepID=UPI000EBB543B|nr:MULTISPECIES: CsgE family curli-type amyloid fiber assembly protein [unclassified Pseudoalteromonas]MCF2922763.1 curli production assembly/transport protein CsgE [Pseudoalteromonas sp. APAL1]HCV04393.1 curli production assembly protein CsgE [Pseudoalteromonas sp.]|tara:strand:+ start:6417 stop:6809 length:393 start_codon:yes stop_codon:yes gene_type:complete
MKNINYLTLTIILLFSVFQRCDANEVEIDGLVLDRSISRFGHQFYYGFSQLWLDLPNSSDNHVVIKETVLPRAGTRLEVLLNNELIYVTFMGRTGGPLKERVESAMFAAMDAIARARFKQTSPDLAPSGW